MNKAATFYLIYWDDVLVGMFSVLNNPNGAMKYAFRIHRIVVLPDFQGLGIGTKIIDFFGKMFLNKGDKLFLKTTHVRFARHCIASNEWVETSESQKTKKQDTGGQSKKYRNMRYDDNYRKAYSFEYVGAEYKLKEHQSIICMGDCSLNKAKFRIQTMLDETKCPIIVTGIANQQEINVWEEVARELGIRTEILFSKSKGEFKLVQKHLKDSFDCILADETSIEMLKPYSDCMNRKYICA